MIKLIRLIGERISLTFQLGIVKVNRRYWEWQIRRYAKKRGECGCPKDFPLHLCLDLTCPRKVRS